jgi:hypothetical protein
VIHGSLLWNKCTSFGSSFSPPGLFGLFHDHAFGEEFAEAMVLIPLVVCGQLNTRSDFLVASNLEFVQVRQVTLGADMGEQMRGVAEGGLFRTDAAIKQFHVHNGQCWGAFSKQRKARKQQRKPRRWLAELETVKSTRTKNDDNNSDRLLPATPAG